MDLDALPPKTNKEQIALVQKTIVDIVNSVPTNSDILIVTHSANVRNIAKVLTGQKVDRAQTCGSVVLVQNVNTGVIRIQSESLT